MFTNLIAQAVPEPGDLEALTEPAPVAPEPPPAPVVETEPETWTGVLERLSEIGEGLIVSVPSLVVALIVFVLLYLVAKLIRWSVERSTRRHKQRHVALVLGRVTQGVIVVVALLIAAVIVFPNFTPASLIQFLGIGSVAVGFAFRDVLQNYLAGILLLLTEPFRIGDQIIFGTYEGTVEDIQTRATFVRTYDGRRVVIPNAELFTNSVLVNTAYENRRLEYDVAIGYGDSIERAKAVIFEALRSSPMVLADPPPKVMTYELADSSVKLRVWWWIEPPIRREALETRDQVLTAIKDALTAEGIDLPFPTAHVLFHDQTEATDGDRTKQREGWPAGKHATPEPRRIADAIERATKREG